jgi:hypothetical protein
VNQPSLIVADLLRHFFATAERWPKPLHRLQGALLVGNGMGLAEAAKRVGTTAAHLMEAATSQDPVATVLGLTDADLNPAILSRLRRKIGELVRGRAAEIAFEDICQGGIDPKEYSMTDLRAGRNNTDFRLLNGGARPLYRFNVKFFGSIFRKAEMVGLTPEDCFPLATYKILAALKQEKEEHLPYVFAIVGVPGLDAEAVAEIIPESDIRPVALLSQSTAVPRKRDFEDWLVDRIVEARAPAFMAAYQKIRNAPWYVLSVRRAEKLMHTMLFDRIYALSVPGFTRNFPGAEVDMHFSLLKDTVTLPDFLAETSPAWAG